MLFGEEFSHRPPTHCIETLTTGAFIAALRAESAETVTLPYNYSVSETSRTAADPATLTGAGFSDPARVTEWFDALRAQWATGEDFAARTSDRAEAGAMRSQATARQAAFVSRSGCKHCSDAAVS